MDKVYAVLRYHNDYDQHGGYLEGVYLTRNEALASISYAGRAKGDYMWYEVEEVTVGEKYEEAQA